MRVKRSRATPLQGPVENNSNTLSYKQKLFNALFKLIVSKLMNLISNKVSYITAEINPLGNGVFNSYTIIYLNIC